MKKADEYEISRFGEFVDKTRERVFFNDEIQKAIKYIRPIMLILGTLFMLFSVFDHLLIRNLHTYYIIFAIRAVAFLLVVVLFLLLGKIKNYDLFALGITIWELITVIAFVVICYFYESPSFSKQVMAVLVILPALFLIPNKWIYMQITATIFILSFIMMSLHVSNPIDSLDLNAGVVYIIIGLAFSSISSLRTNYYKRAQYINSQKLLKISQTDSLTGICNRGKFNDELVKWMTYSYRYKVPLSMCIFDFDDFKQVNDHFGHLVGDKVLIEIVGIINKEIRQCDVFARWGGEEFIILLPNTGTQDALELTERLRKLISGHTFEMGQAVTCSFGVVSLEDGDTIDSYLSRADELLYVAKKAGKNTVAQ